MGGRPATAARRSSPPTPCAAWSAAARTTWTPPPTRSTCSSSVVAARTGRGLTTVVDTLGTDDDRRRRLAGPGPGGRAARRGVVMDTPDAECRRRNAARDRPGAGARRWPASSSGTARWSPQLDAEGWDVVHTVVAASRAVCPTTPRRSGTGPGREERRTLAGAQGGAPGEPVPVGRGPAGLADRRRPGRRRGRLRRAVGDGPPDPDPPGRPGLGADPGAVGDPRRARRARHRPRARHPGHAGDVPGARASPPRRPPRSTCSPAAGRSSASAPAGGSASTRRTAWPSRRRRSGSTTSSAASRRCGRCGRPAPRRTTASGSACRRRPATRGRRATIPVIVGGTGRAHPADRRHASATPPTSRPPGRGSTSTSPRCAGHSDDRADHRARPADDRHRPRGHLGAGRAAARADRRGGVRRAHPRRHRRRAARPLGRRWPTSASTPCSSAIADLEGPDDVERLAPLTAAELGYLSSALDSPRTRRATISCWICWVPSKMSRILESRAHFSSSSVSL